LTGVAVMQGLSWRMYYEKAPSHGSWMEASGFHYVGFIAGLLTICKFSLHRIRERE
jgi:hypothetical protein